MMVIEPIAKAVSGLGNNINGNKNIDMNSNINYNGIGNGTDNHISNGIDNDIGIEKIYDFDLVMGGGHVRGYRITGHKMIQNIASALKKLAEPEYFHRNMI